MKTVEDLELELKETEEKAILLQQQIKEAFELKQKELFSDLPLYFKQIFQGHKKAIFIRLDKHLEGNYFEVTDVRVDDNQMFLNKHQECIRFDRPGCKLIPLSKEEFEYVINIFEKVNALFEIKG